MIKSNDTNSLRVELSKYDGIGDFRLPSIDSSLCANVKINGQALDPKKLNMVLVCILLSSHQSLRVIFEKFPNCIRESLKGEDTSDDQEVKLQINENSLL